MGNNPRKAKGLLWVKTQIDIGKNDGGGIRSTPMEHALFHTVSTSLNVHPTPEGGEIVDGRREVAVEYGYGPLRNERYKGVEEHRSLGGSIISRLDNGAFVGLIY